MKLGALRCGACGRERFVRAQERGATVACDKCGEPIEVPQNLSFPEYTELYRDRSLASTAEAISILGFVIACLPACAWAWWTCSGAIQRSRDEGRPPDPLLHRARKIAVAATVVQSLGWLYVAYRMR